MKKIQVGIIKALRNSVSHSYKNVEFFKKAMPLVNPEKFAMKKGRHHPFFEEGNYLSEHLKA